MSHNTVSTYDQHGSAGSHNSSPNSTVRGGAGGTATAAEIAAANAAADEKERFKNSRQSSRSRRRLLSSQEFSGNNSAKGSSKAGQLSGDQDGKRRSIACFCRAWIFLPCMIPFLFSLLVNLPYLHMSNI
jgi:hypothetical protein